MENVWQPYEIEDGFLVVMTDGQAKPMRKMCKCGGNKKTAEFHARAICDALNGKELAAIRAENAELLEALKLAYDLLTCAEIERLRLRGYTADVRKIGSAIQNATKPA